MNRNLRTALILAISFAPVTAMSLYGCGATNTDAAAITAPVTKPIDLKPICGTVKAYSPAESAALAIVVGSLPADSPIIPAMGDYRRMRDEARACAAATK